MADVEITNLLQKRPLRIKETMDKGDLDFARYIYYLTRKRLITIGTLDNVRKFNTEVLNLVPELINDVPVNEEMQALQEYKEGGKRKSRRIKRKKSRKQKTRR